MRASLSKDRDMARSILPSRYRRTIRGAKAHVKRAHRHRVRDHLQSVTRLGDLDEWDARLDLRRDTSTAMWPIVSWRRAGDKLNHFERWAIATTRDVRPEDRLSTLQARLPRGLIGDHALSHLRRRAELNPDSRSERWRSVWLDRRRRREELNRIEREALAEAVRRLVDDGGHRALNEAMKALVLTPDGHRTRPPYLLRERGDVEVFVAGLYLPDPWDHRRTRELDVVAALVGHPTVTKKP